MFSLCGFRGSFLFRIVSYSSLFDSICCLHIFSGKACTVCFALTLFHMYILIHTDVFVIYNKSKL